MARLVPDPDARGELFSAYLDGQLSPDEVGLVSSLLDGDEEVILEFRSLQRVRRSLRLLPEFEVPANLLPDGHLGDRLSAYLDGELVTTYPEFDEDIGGWQVIAEPDGEMGAPVHASSSGTVVAIENDHVIVNAGLKSEGIIPKIQFTDYDGNVECAVGDQVEVALDAVEDGFGATRLSREKAKRNQAWEHLEGGLSEGEWVERAIIATRQYAKRQLTWLRSEPGCHWFDPFREDAVARIRVLLDNISGGVH